jgi:hypothetical protein
MVVITIDTSDYRSEKKAKPKAKRKRKVHRHGDEGDYSGLGRRMLNA